MRIFILLGLAVLLCFSPGGGGALAVGGRPLTIYVVPAITDAKILPDSFIFPGYISDSIRVTACPGEYRAASFVLRAAENLTALTVTPGDLSSGNSTVPAGNVDIRVVKCWYQAGTGQDVIYDVAGKFLTPELLLKDDSLIRVEGEENYIWNRATGVYTWISERAPVSVYSFPPSEFAVSDSETLQPVDVIAGSNKQFWVTVNVPEGQSPGVYTGMITLSAGAVVYPGLRLELKVLPFTLLPPYPDYCLYYCGDLDSVVPGISSYSKTEAQFAADLTDMLEHGITNPRQSVVGFPQALALRERLGMTNRSVFLAFHAFDSASLPDSPAELEEVKAVVRQVIEVCRQHGITDVYFYGLDEANHDLLIAQRPAFQAIHEAGGKVYCSGAGWDDSVFAAAGDLIDVFVASGAPTTVQSERWHMAGHRIFSYDNPQAGVEKPETYRRNYGLLLWQKGYDGEMDFAYQWPDMSNPWNDFDSVSENRDHNFTYPTTDGKIDTVEWEGMREGINDVRYLTTLLKYVDTAKVRGKDVTAAEAWLTNLKSSDLTMRDLDAVRSGMIGYILQFRADYKFCPATRTAITK